MKTCKLAIGGKCNLVIVGWVMENWGCVLSSWGWWVGWVGGGGRHRHRQNLLTPQHQSCLQRHVRTLGDFPLMLLSIDHPELCFLKCCSRKMPTSASLLLAINNGFAWREDSWRNWGKATWIDLLWIYVSCISDVQPSNINGLQKCFVPFLSIPQFIALTVTTIIP